MDDIHSLPLRMGADCELPRASAEILQHRSRRLREHLSYCGGGADQVRGRLIADGGGMWRTPAAVPTLVQMLQAESTSFRMLLVEWLSRTKGPEAGRALAGRAVFDVETKVRDAALSALRSRPWSDYRDVLLDALRHPWPAAADCAAQALVKLEARSVVPVLAEMLDAPNPTAPFELKGNGSSTYHVRELVRINHLKNCIVCHAVSNDENHLVRAAPPDPNQPLPPAFTPAYYRADNSRLMVRADVTYLRQDFSMMLPVSDSGKWPTMQRFDFVVRTRRLTADEWNRTRSGPQPYPQREAVLYALRELTGIDAGDQRGAWRVVVERYSH